MKESRCRRYPLDRHQTVFALGEALAHLHYLEGRGMRNQVPGPMASIALSGMEMSYKEDVCSREQGRKVMQAAISGDRAHNSANRRLWISLSRLRSAYLHLAR